MARTARAAYHGPPRMRAPPPSTTSRDRGPITASARTTRKRKAEREEEGEGEARERAADRPLAGMCVVDEMDPRLRPDGSEPLVEAEAREPRGDLRGSELGSAEGVAVAGDPLGEQHAEERHEERAEEVEEILVVDEVDDERPGGGHAGDGEDQ